MEKIRIRNKEDECSIMLWNVPRRLRAQFKHVCAKDRRPMRRVFLTFMKDVVEKGSLAELYKIMP